MKYARVGLGVTGAASKAHIPVEACHFDLGKRLSGCAPGLTPFEEDLLLTKVAA